MVCWHIMAVNESFIDSAQLRTSVVSLAKLLGYTPRSYSAAKALLSGEFTASPSGPNKFIFEKGYTLCYVKCLCRII